MGRVEGKVAFITGAARGQGRSHAIRLAEEGADIIAVDICKEVVSNIAVPATADDLAHTVKEVESRDRRIVASQVDVRDVDALQTALDQGIDQLGRLDIVCANAGSWTFGLAHELSEAEWQETVDIVLTGAWHTAKVAVPHLIRQGQGGSIVFTSSLMGLKGGRNIAHYSAAKHGVVGLMRSMAIELGQYGIRVNTVNPGAVDTALLQNAPTYSLFAPEEPEPTREMLAERMALLHVIPVPWVEPEDVSNAVLFLASDEARYITGATLSIDAGSFVK
jgi:SDR family mycofactocin-dependent oxidoreductase